MSDTTAEKRPVGRPPRQQEVQAQRRRRTDAGLDGNLKLHVPQEAKDPNFEYRWANDRPGRVQQLYQQDWDQVSTTQMEGGDPDPLKNLSEGTQLRRTVDGGRGDAAVLMRKPKEFYKDDKAREQKSIDATEDAMRRGAPPSPEGLSGQTAYVPGGKNVIGRQ